MTRCSEPHHWKRDSSRSVLKRHTARPISLTENYLHTSCLILPATVAWINSLPQFTMKYKDIKNEYSCTCISLKNSRCTCNNWQHLVLEHVWMDQTNGWMTFLFSKSENSKVVPKPESWEKTHQQTNVFTNHHGMLQKMC